VRCGQTVRFCTAFKGGIFINNKNIIIFKSKLKKSITRTVIFLAFITTKLILRKNYRGKKVDVTLSRVFPG
jgi:hypothetical protein